ncbi:hypothetical protein OF83DRAFT_1180761 [Amylostereum chailletii]|nr:hypothetical protein OF83DRAFT_1180761 [Amylostereum chailletii]
MMNSLSSLCDLEILVLGVSNMKLLDTPDPVKFTKLRRLELVGSIAHLAHVLPLFDIPSPNNIRLRLDHPKDISLEASDADETGHKLRIGLRPYLVHRSFGPEGNVFFKVSNKLDVEVRYTPDTVDPFATTTSSDPDFSISLPAMSAAHSFLGSLLLYYPFDQCPSVSIDGTSTNKTREVMGDLLWTTILPRFVNAKHLHFSAAAAETFLTTLNTSLGRVCTRLDPRTLRLSLADLERTHNTGPSIGNILRKYLSSQPMDHLECLELQCCTVSEATVKSLHNLVDENVIRWDGITMGCMTSIMASPDGSESVIYPSRATFSAMLSSFNFISSYPFPLPAWWTPFSTPTPYPDLSSVISGISDSELIPQRMVVKHVTSSQSSPSAT